ncbi:hypothetical protein EPUS_01002 [Endocarpon pusillum Z07020]|uniref:Amine oxidase domain-containing protein n=1 Tax=Endocarpon pusillum (strain Z07020 / HMAS-L-300199) TaxID=1263415 RepID=U1GN95_ENDPU|nr:uncharacterized protein EPUS_01002 [Endocarpon pusillum Z07020]ERF73748.1 hypothetical protein EPUS_01002 [Endocarpon pusillum Z07020]
MLSKFCLCLLASAAGALGAALQTHDQGQFDPSSYSANNVVQTDFAIIGGGAAGSYAAIALKDQNQTFTLVEITDRLGGNTNTFRDPSTGAVVDFGVQIHLDTPIVRNFFSRLNSSLSHIQLSDFGLPKYFDFTQRVALPDYVRGNVGADYVALLDQYSYLADLNNLPAQVPSDLLLNWPDFAQKVGLSENSTTGGLNWPATPGDALTTSALAILNDGHRTKLAEFQGDGVRAANRDNSQIYRNALAEIQANVLLQSSIVAARRGSTPGSGVQLVANTPTGNKLISAKQLIIAFPYTPDRINAFGLDSREQSILSKISGKYYYGGVVNNTNLEAGVSYLNAGANTPYNTASVPGVVRFAPSASPGYYFYWYNTVSPLTRTQIESLTRSTIGFLESQINATASEPTFVAFKDFSPFHLAPSNTDIANGWYTQMKGLQGYRNTWYISAMFVVGSTQVWNNTANILPSIIEAANQY